MKFKSGDCVREKNTGLHCFIARVENEHVLAVYQPEWRNYNGWRDYRRFSKAKYEDLYKAWNRIDITQD